MEILILYPGGIGAGRTFSYEMAAGLVKNGQDVYAIVADAQEDRDKWVDLLGKEKIYFFVGHRGGKDFAKRLVTLPFTDGTAIRRKFSRITFDMVLKPMYHIWSDRLLPYISTRKIVSVCHDPLPHSSSKKYVQYLSKRFTMNSDDVVVLTKSFIPIVEKRHKIAREHIFYMPHGRFPGYSVNPDKRLVHFAEDKTNFVFFGRIQRYKGIGILLEAYQMLRKEYDDITLTIAGNGDMQPYQKYLNGDESIKVINRFIDDDEVGSLFDGPNAILVLPYIDATQSGVTLVAFEYGVPIIATNTGGLREQLNNGKIGLLCQPNDAQSLCDAMKKCIHNPDFVQEQKRLTAAYLHELDWEVLMDKLLKQIYGEK